MRLLNLVEQHHRVGLAADCLRELPPLVVPHVAGRCADKSGRAELLLVLAHIDPGHHVLIVEQVLGQRLGQLGFTHAGGSQEDKRADGSLGVAQPGTATPHRIGHRLDRLLLPHYPLVQFILQVQQFLPLARQHAVHRYPGPPRHHVGDILGIHLLLDHGTPTLSLM